MITADSRYTIDGADVFFADTTKISADATYLPRSETVSLVLRVLNGADEFEVATHYLSLRSTDVDAETGAGTGETATWYNAVEQAVVTYLEALAENTGVAFSVGA